MFKRLLLIIFILAALTGCQIPQPKAATSTPAQVKSVPATSTVAPLLNPTVTPPGSTATAPAPTQPGTGAVKGQLFSTTMNAPLGNIGVYLGEYVYLTPGPDYLISIRQNGSPHTVSDEQGRFVIQNVKPGKYPFLLWTPNNSHTLPDESGKKEMVITVVADKVTDLGEIKAAFP